MYFCFLLAHEVEELLVAGLQCLVEPQGYVQVGVIVLVLLLSYQEAFDPQLVQLEMLLQLR